MAIQKFKFGQEITSSKLNEIVTFVNNLEGFLQSSQYWNENVDSKIAVFQTQLNNIVNQVKGLLDSSESFETLLTAFIDLKAKYESLVTQNIQVLLSNIFNPTNVTVNSGGFFVINGITTNVQLTTLVGPQGANGQNGADGATGPSGKTILTGTTNPDNNNGVNGDLYFNRNNFNFHIKENSVWVLVGNLKGPQGSRGLQGYSAQILFRYQTDVGLPYLTQPPASNLIKFLEYKVIYSNESNEQIELKPWIRIQVRNDRFFPVLSSGTQGQLFLNWSSDETTWSENPQGVNIRGDRGIDGINGTNGTNGTSVSIKGSFASHTNLPTSGAILGDGYLIAGFLWVYTAGTTTGTPPAVGSIVNGFLNVGLIRGPVGPSPTIQAEVVATLNPAESASVVVDPISGVEGGYRLNFSIPRGATGTRGSLIFSVATPEDLPTQASWNSITLLVNDLFIVVSTGEIRRLVAITPTWDLALVFTAAASVHTHGNITNAGAIGSTAGQVVVTGTNGVLTIQTRSGIDSRSTFEPSSHTHGNITNGGAIGTTADLVAVTTTSGVLTTASRSGIDSRSTFTPSAHGHPISAITDLQTSLDGKAPVSHGHPISAITNLQTSLDGKAASSHTHAISDVTDLQTTLNSKATPSDITTAINNLVASAPGALNTLDELAAALGDDANYAATITTALAGKAASSHSHTSSDLPANTVIGTTYPGSYAPTDGSILYRSVYGWSTTTTPSVAGLAASSHTHTINNVTYPELMSSTPVTANAGSSAIITLNTTLNLNLNPKIKIYWKTTGRWGYHCSEFLLESESYQKYVSGSYYNWNLDNSPARMEFYTVNFTFSSNASSSSLVDRITIQNGKRWFLDGSTVNQDDISDVQITVLSVTRAAG